jgi:ABC-2 type transport system permease protein
VSEVSLPHPRVVADTRRDNRDFLTPPEESRVFWRMRWRTARTVLGQLLTHSRFRVTLVVFLSTLLWLGLFWLMADGFSFLRTAIPHPETRAQTVRAVFGMFFFALLLMLVFSSGVILYGSLFCSPETAFLLTLPARVQRVFLHKFQEAVLLSSWGFVLLGSPMLLAYGIVARAPWYYYAMLPAFVIAFVYVPVSLGAILCLEIVYRLPRSRTKVLTLVAVALAACLAWVGASLALGAERDLLTPGWFQEMLRRLQFTEGRLLPSWWLSTGLLEAARNEWAEGVMFLALLISNALAAREVAIWRAGTIFRRAYSGVCTARRGRKRSRSFWIDHLLRKVFVLPMPVRLLMIKDLRVFRRDPVQWSQFLVFFALLALYFVNIRRFHYDMYYIAWVQMISFLNLAVVGLLLSTFTTRFIFPMISLEGRRFWLLGLLPLRRETILWSKFAFAAGGSILPCCLLIFLSDAMLRVSPLVFACHQWTCLILCLGLSGIAVGLGARFPNLREVSPARIAAGFGGTLNLVVSTLYILVIVLLTALPCHFYVAARYGGVVNVSEPAGASYWNFWLELWLGLGVAVSLLVGVVATVVPLRIGFRAFREMEF